MADTSSRWLPLWRRDGTAQRVIAPIAVLVVVSDTLVRWALATGIGIGVRPVGLVVVAAAVMVGKPARWGTAAGLLVTGSLLAGWTNGVVWSIAAFAAAAVTDRLWAREERDRDGGTAAWYVRYWGAALGGVVTLATTSALLLDVLGRSAFSVAVGPVLGTNLPLALVGAPLVRLVVVRTDWGRARTSAPPSPAARLIALVVVVCWAVFGYVGSFLFRATGQMAPGVLGRRLSPTVETLVGIWGWQGTYAQAVLGLASLVVLGILLCEDRDPG